MLTVWNDVYPWLISAFGGFIGAALLLPTNLGKALLQLKIDKALEGFRAEQSRSLEKLKEQLNHIGDRGRRSNELEFSSIEIVWRVFVKAWLSTNTCIGSMTTIPRFSTMTEEEIESFATNSGMSEREKKSLLRSADREKEYSNLIAWRRVVEAGTDVYHARLTLREQRIFMPAFLTKEFGDVIEQMSSAQVQRRLALENPHIKSYDFGKATTDWLSDCVPTFEKMATLANERLFHTEREQSTTR